MSESSQKLHAAIAAAGYASRRQAERLIEAGQVTVNGRSVTNVACRIDPRKDQVTIKGQTLTLLNPQRVVHLFHKPVNVLSTTKDERGRRTILDYFPQTPRLYPVGRLDRDTSGAIIVTNDGDLAHAIAHPRSELPKTYRMRGFVNRPLTTVLELFEQGIQLQDGFFRSDRVTYLKRAGAREFVIELVIHEGRNRIIRRAAAAAGFEITELTRTHIGPIELGRLAVGTAREITQEELAALTALIKLQPAKS